MDRFFDQFYNKLNPAQKKAVDTIEGPVMVIAGPGTGKTTILTLRIANILRQTDTPPSGILAITFTEAGVKAMRMKLREIIGSRADEVRIHTFHGFAASVINEFRDHFYHLDKSKQMSDIDTESMIRTILRDERYVDLRPYSNPDFYIQKILGAISDSKREALSPEDIRSHIKKQQKTIKADENSYSTRGKTKGELKADAQKLLEKCERTLLFADVYELYEATKRETHKMDYDDLLTELLTALKKDELLLRMLQEKFLYILVDEHQDTNDTQNGIIKLLADFFDTPNIFIVGDEKQAIYRFQGASVANFLRFQSQWKEIKIIQLTNNYRSHQGILDASFGMIEKNYSEGEYEELRAHLIGRKDVEARPIDLVVGDTMNDCDEFLVKELRRLSETEPDATIAIITKTNRELERILRLAETHDIPVSSERSVDIFSHPVGALFFKLLECCHDPSHSESLAYTLAAGLWNIPFDQAVEIIRDLRSGKNSSVLSCIPSLKFLAQESTREGALNFLLRVAEESGFVQLIVGNPSYVEVWRGIEQLAESILRENQSDDPRSLVEKLLAYKASAETRSIKISVGSPEAQIQVMTAHGSKGLEFDYVVIPNATDEGWIGRARSVYFVLPMTREEEDYLKDARRLFYVALTRARKHVTLLCPGTESGGGELMPLRFISEFTENTVTTIQLQPSRKKLDGLLKQKGTVSASLSESRQQKLLEYTKGVLMTKGLSVTALNNFLMCPSYFLYQSILKLPQIPSAHIEKGNAFHTAFDAIWRSSDRSAKTIEKLLTEITLSHIDDSLLPLFEKQSIKKELVRDIPIVVKELTAHFSTQGTIFSESWSETTHSLAYEGKKITVPIHGKLDVVIDTGERVEVFDYKTRESMSVAAIKGETQSSDGNYFRQLVFYRMLLSEDSRYRGKHIIPHLVFVRPDAKKCCPIVSIPIEAKDIEKVRQEIDGLIQSVWSGDILTSRCDDEKCEWCKLKHIQ